MLKLISMGSPSFDASTKGLCLVQLLSLIFIDYEGEGMNLAFHSAPSLPVTFPSNFQFSSTPQYLSLSLSLFLETVRFHQPVASNYNPVPENSSRHHQKAKMAAFLDVPDLEIDGSSSDDDFCDESFTSDDLGGSDEEETNDTALKLPADRACEADNGLKSAGTRSMRKHPLPELNLLTLPASPTVNCESRLTYPPTSTSWADLVDEEEEFELISTGSPDLVHITSLPLTALGENRLSTSHSIPIAEAPTQSDEGSNATFRGAVVSLSDHQDRLEVVSWADLVDEEEEFDLIPANSPDLIHMPSSPLTALKETRPSTSHSISIAEAPTQSDEGSNAPSPGAVVSISDHQDRLQVVRQYAISTLAVLRTDEKRFQSQGQDLLSWLTSHCQTLEDLATRLMDSATCYTEDMICRLEAQMDDIEQAYGGDQDHMPPALGATSDRITDDRLHADSVKIAITHPQRQAAVSTVQGESAMSILRETAQAPVWNVIGRGSPLFRELMKMRLGRKVQEEQERRQGMGMDTDEEPLAMEVICH
ncbi:hypothetical protein CONLIGDRAFT_649852 [Coniochaeta ligniaria NRRL 30616]|uniref:Uncharacterized protein n=1 Tax=Coniochaeta ligniaria NRRL 30616 TaxID=1408157 RepID=A0A1J7IQF8_9PEZI|nr:hypothetical protein CONLIGDRAFT_649852 [Coniochaeta ligniaria NRRL 30616]